MSIFLLVLMFMHFIRVATNVRPIRCPGGMRIIQPILYLVSSRIPNFISVYQYPVRQETGYPDNVKLLLLYLSFSLIGMHLIYVRIIRPFFYIRYPDFELAGYPVKTVSDASLI
jgi:hypothetical protein